MRESIDRTYIDRLMKCFFSSQISVGDVMDGVRSRIKSLYHLPAGTDVFLCPSGSDAEYIPLLIAKTLNKRKKVETLNLDQSFVRSVADFACRLSTL